MPFLLVFYLLVIGIVLSAAHGYRVIAAGRRFGATVGEIQAAGREKRMIRTSALVAAGYLGIILISLLLGDWLYEWIVLLPFVYLLTWVALHWRARRLVRRSDPADQA
jgi:hypothetical protein